jgi:hypothetical protein
MPENMQWEYRFVSFGNRWKISNDREIEKALNEWGVEGWEVVDVAFSYPYLKVIARRPLTSAVRRERSAEDRF